jgi:putative ABC transport system permease protein
LGEIEENGDPGYVAVFSILAFLVILIAAVNFVNLSTARSVVRAREVGLRKVVGATRRQLVRQFLGETGALTLMAFVAAILLAGAGLPLFNSVAGTSLSAAGLADPAAIALILGIIALTSLAAGGYPAFLLSSFRPVEALRPQARLVPGRVSIRRTLVVTQFAVSVALMIMTGVVLEQMRFVNRRDLGFRKDSVIEIPLASTPLAKAWEPFRDALRRNPSVLAVSAAMGSPYRGWLQRDETVGADKVPVRVFPVDEDYLDTLGIPIVAGRSFSRDHPSDRASSVLINETAARVFGLADPIGKTFNKTGGKGTIIGVVKDFHTASLREPIIPASFEIAPRFFSHLIVRLDPRSVPAALAFIAQEWRRAAPRTPFQYSFLDDVIRGSYQSEDRFARVFLAFSVLALLIAGLGLFGLSSYSTSRRTKEIGIRKVLGASSAKVTWLLAGEMLRLILIACLAAAPLAWWAARTWLQKFAFQAGISAWVFVSASVLAMAVGLLTVILHSVRAAATDPVIALKYE